MLLNHRKINQTIKHTFLHQVFLSVAEDQQWASLTTLMNKANKFQ